MNEEIPEDYYLKYPEEGNTGVEKELQSDLENARAAMAWLEENLLKERSDKAALIATFKELIKVIEYIDYAAPYTLNAKDKSAIDNAKRLIGGPSKEV